MSGMLECSKCGERYLDGESKTDCSTLGCPRRPRIFPWSQPENETPSPRETMSDLEMTKLCAEAMGLDHSVEYRGGYIGNPEVVELHDPELRRKNNPLSSPWVYGPEYTPLHDDAQAMALVKQLLLRIEPPTTHYSYWRVYRGVLEICSADLNRAIVECVAKMQADKNA